MEHAFPQLLSPQGIQEELSSGRIQLVVADSDSGCAKEEPSTPSVAAVLGIRTSTGNTHGCSELFGLMTRPQLQKNGVGLKLMKAMATHLETSPNFKFTFCSSRASQPHVTKLCASHGFLPVGIEPVVYTWQPGTRIFASTEKPHEDMIHMCKISDEVLRERRRSADPVLPKLAHRLASVVLPMFDVKIPPKPSGIEPKGNDEANVREPAASRVLPVQLYEAMIGDSSQKTGVHFERRNYAYRDQNGRILAQATCLWDVTHANLLLDSLELMSNDQTIQFNALQELCKSMTQDGIDSIPKSKQEHSAPSLSIVFVVSSKEATIAKALEKLECVPVAYYPAAIETENKERVDVIRYLLMPKLSQKEGAKIVEEMSLSRTRLDSPDTNGFLHASFRVIKSMLLESAGRRLEAQSIPFLGFPAQNLVPLWRWRQFGWEEMIEAAWPQILQEFRANQERARSQPVRVWGQQVNPRMAWRKLVFTFTGVDLIETHEAFPITSAILRQIPNLMGAEFSVLPPGGTISEHNNCVFEEMIRTHLGVIVPPGDVQFKIGGRQTSWQEGGLLVFDDTFPHSAWNRTDQERVVLMIDVKRPTDPRPVTEIITQQWHKWYSLLHRSSTGRNIEFDTDTDGLMSLKHSVLPFLAPKYNGGSLGETDPYPGVSSDMFWYVLSSFYPQFKRRPNATKEHPPKE
jgi:hypothetical protein